MKDFAPTRADLARLADKYRTLGDLRRDHAKGSPPPTDGSLRALARAFPGALRELDQLTLEEIDRREHTLRSASSGDDFEPWMGWIHGYHGALRASLYVKARGRKPLTDTTHAILAARASEHAAYSVDEAFVSLLLQPGSCRITLIALSLVAERAGVDAAEIRAELLPRARR